MFCRGGPALGRCRHHAKDHIVTITTILNLAAVVVTLAAVFGFINHRWLGLPNTIGLVVIALAVSMAAIGLDAVFPRLAFESNVQQALELLDLSDVLMKGMLSFLLFAGALHVDLAALLSRKWLILVLATVGTLLSTVLVAIGTFYLLTRIGLAMPFIYCLVFGALISPTDPVAVLGILKRVAVPPSLEAKIAGESLFNDGVGIVLFTILLAIAGAGAAGHGVALTPRAIALLFVTEAGGGILLGLVAGLIAYRAMRAIDEYALEVLISLALVMGSYMIATAIEVSGPLAVVIAGLFIGNHGTKFAMSERTRDHLEKFWSLIDDILNSVLFLAIGFEVVALTLNGRTILAMALAIPLVLASRFASVFVPVTLFGLQRSLSPGAVPVLTWGGVRGGISVALALALPAFPGREVILAMTYAVVIFSIIVQGLTLEHVIKRVIK